MRAREEPEPAAALPPAAAAMLVGGLMLGAMSGAAMKALSAELPPLMVTWFRFAGFALLLLPVVALRAGRVPLRPRRPWVQVARGLCMAIGNVAFVAGVREMPLGDAIAILYAYPFLMTAMAALFLSERVGLAGWLGVAGGFAGVLLVMQPEVGRIDLSALLILFTALMVAVQMILNRTLGMLSDPLVITFWGACVATVALAPGLPAVWEPFGAREAGIMLLSAASGAACQTLLVMAFARAPAATLAPLTYSEIVWAVTIGAIVFGTLPDALSWAGIALIAASGVMLVRVRGARTISRRLPKI